MPIPTRSADTVEVCLGILGKVEIDDNIDGLNINTASEQI